MSDAGGFNPFDDGDTAADSPSSSPSPHSPSSPSSPLAASTTTSLSTPSTSYNSTSFLSTPDVTSPYKTPVPTAATDIKLSTNGYHSKQHDDNDTLYQHIAHIDPPPPTHLSINTPTTPTLPAPASAATAQQTQPDTQPDTEPTEYGSLVSTTPSLFTTFTLTAQPDTYDDVLSSLSSLTTSLRTLQTQYTTQYAATLATSHAQQRHYQHQHDTIRHDITHLQAQLNTLQHDKTTAQHHLHTLTHTVNTRQHTHNTLNTTLHTLTQHYTHLTHKLTRRRSHTHSHAAATATGTGRHQPKQHIRLLTLRPSTATGQWRVALPAVAVELIFGCLDIRQVESAVRTCKRWQCVVGRSGVWKQSLKRIAGNKRAKEREREESGSQVTRDEFDAHWNDDRDEQRSAMDDNHSADELGGDDSSSAHDMDGHHSSSPPASPTSSSKQRKEGDAAFHLTPAAAAALNLPPVDSPVPDHLHYALTVDLTRDQYTISITSRHITTLYQCAACSDSLTPGQPQTPPLPKTATTVICCTLVPKASTVADLQFCQQMMAQQEQISVAKQDVTRLQNQVASDIEVKRRLQAELSECENALRSVQAQLDTAMQQQMSDEMTRQFIDDSVTTTHEQLDAEQQQTIQLTAMLRDAYIKRDSEVSGMEAEAEGMVAVVEGLREDKVRLTRDVKRLQGTLEGVVSERERAKKEYDRLMDLIIQLREL